MAKKYFFRKKLDKSGRTYYQNQDGKRVSAAKVKTGRRTVIDETRPTVTKYQKSGRTYYKDGEGKRVSKKNVEATKARVKVEIQRGKEKGTYDLESQKISRKKPGKVGKVKTFKLFGNDINGELERTEKKKIRLFVTMDGETFEIKTEQAKKNLLLFNHEFNQSFYKKLKEKIDSPTFDVDLKEDIKGKTVLIDYDSANIDEDILEDFPDIKKNFQAFKRESKKAFKKYFK